VETAPSEWLLTTLLRGQLGTREAMQAGAPQGADFVLIDQAVVPAGLKREECGLPLSWRTGPAGFDFSDLYYGEQQAVGGLTARRPPAPAHLSLRRSGTASTIAWVRRGRPDIDGGLAADLPPGAEGETFALTLAAADGSVRRRLIVTGQSFIYADAAFAADFGGRPAVVDVAVAQVAADGTAGPAAARRFSF